MYRDTLISNNNDNHSNNMSDSSPDLAAWEDIVPESDEEQLFNLDRTIRLDDYDSDGSWTTIKTKLKPVPTQKPGQSSTDASQPRQCKHLAERNCALSALGHCCECSDKRTRTDSGLYTMYVDGRGWVHGATRWAFYCPGCRAYHETTVLNQMMERLQKLAAQREEARQKLAKSQCEHWLERRCSITNTGKCCACSDLRPGTKSQLYPAYVDGKGWITDTTRWAYYCPGCKQYDESHQDPEASSFIASRQALLEANTITNVHANSRLHIQILTARRQTCPHLISRSCSMTATGDKCCECADQRPRSESGFYFAYVDGKGLVEEAPRWAGYCPNCQRAFDNIAAMIFRYSPKHRLYNKIKPAEPPIQHFELLHVDNQANQSFSSISTERDHAEGLTHEDACHHWQARNCSLTSNPKRCCSCSDKRPNAPSYHQYVDGIGWEMGATRWDHYCPGCRNHHVLSECQVPTSTRQTRPKRRGCRGGQRTRTRHLQPDVVQILT